MLDFASALYLGLRHASGSLRPWEQLTTGAPAALAEPPGADRIAGRLAALIGCERATLAASTLHLFWDLFGMVGADGFAIYMDAGAYPIARWGVERAVARGVPLRTFSPRDARGLGSLMRQNRSGRRPVVVTDGFWPGHGAAAPIAAYLECVRPYGGQVIVDDTQALGIFGHSAGPEAPYGIGGGGSLRRWDIGDQDVIVISSLAKGFGVPMAVMAGSHVLIDRFEARSETRVHCSPPSAAAIHAAEHALDVNDRHGDALRSRLAQNVRHFRSRLAERGLGASRGLFPVQILTLTAATDAVALDERLLASGIKAVLHPGRNGSAPRLSFIISAHHRRSEIDWAVDSVAAGIKMRRVGKALRR